MQFRIWHWNQFFNHKELNYQYIHCTYGIRIQDFFKYFSLIHSRSWDISNLRLNILLIFWFLTCFTSKRSKTFIANPTHFSKSLNLPPTFHNSLLQNNIGKLLEPILMLLILVKRFGHGETEKKFSTISPNPCLLG